MLPTPGWLAGRCFHLGVIGHPHYCGKAVAEPPAPITALHIVRVRLAADWAARSFPPRCRIDTRKQNDHNENNVEADR